MSITDNNNLNLNKIKKLNLIINCISAKSPPQICSIKGGCTFLLLKFLIIGLCKSFVNS